MKWTKKEEDYLRDNTSQTNEEIGKALGRSSDSIQKKRKRLGLKLPEPEITIKTVRNDINTRVQKSNEKQLNKQVKLLSDELIKVEKERDAFLQVGGVKPQTIVGTKSNGSLSDATAIVLASDWHYEENVKKSQVNGLNEFNTVIAAQRIEKFFKVVAGLISVHQKEYKIDSLILALLGDFISGSIHDDLMEANTIQPTQAIWEVQNLIASGIEYLLKETDVNLIIPCSAGNHSRITEKQRMTTEYGNSLEILMYNQLAKYFSKEKRINFIVDDAYLTYINVYGFTLRFHHGHSIRYGGGIGGIFIPAFKAISQWDKQKKADWTFFGHFHQLKDGGNFITNGSLIGFNAYAVRIKADYERPKQAFIIIDKERGLDVVRKITL